MRFSYQLSLTIQSLNNSHLIQLDHYILSDWYTLITDPKRTDRASNVFFHILPKKGKLNETYQRFKNIPHLYTYLKEEIPVGVKSFITGIAL